MQSKLREIPKNQIASDLAEKPTISVIPGGFLRSNTRKPITCDPVRPPATLSLAYKKKLDALIDEMNKSVTFWVLKEYGANPPEIAMDASPAFRLRSLFKQLSDRWLRRFNSAAPEMARFFATSQAQRSDKQMRAILKKAGITVVFKWTKPMNDAYQAVIGENVGLIRSIAQEHLSDVEGLVMRSVQRGNDLAPLAAELQARYGLTKKRAALIAHDQNAKATAVLTRVRQIELCGPRAQAMWKHSSAGKVPRPGHVKADRDRLIFDVVKGAYIDGEWILPGQLINCRCYSRMIIPGIDTPEAHYETDGNEA